MEEETRVDQQIHRRRLAVAAWIYYTAALAMVLAVLHGVTAALFMKKPAITMLPAEWERIFLFLYLAAGVAVFFAASTVIYVVPGLRRKEVWAWTLAVRAATLMLLIGAGALAVMAENPFAQLTLLFSLALLFPLFWYRNLLDPRVRKIMQV